MRFTYSLLPLTLLAAAGCAVSTEETADTGHVHNHSTDTGDDADTPPDDMDVALQFMASVGDVPAGCGSYDSTHGTTTLEVADFRFYVSSIALIDAEGHEVPVILEQDGLWQVNDVALLDFEDASGPCISGTPDLNDTVYGTAPAGTYTGVAFDLGVPHQLNHNDVTVAPSPLNVSSMFWSWQSGYKFVRIDMENDAGVGWYFHLGSTGCDSDASTMPPDEACAFPNRPRIRVDGFDLSTQALELDLDRLLTGADLGLDTPESSPGCMSGVADAPECGPLFDNLGLDFETGTCVDDCAGQTVFSGVSK